MHACFFFPRRRYNHGHRQPHLHHHAWRHHLLWILHVRPCHATPSWTRRLGQGSMPLRANLSQLKTSYVWDPRVKISFYSWFNIVTVWSENDKPLSCTHVPGLAASQNQSVASGASWCALTSRWSMSKVHANGPSYFHLKALAPSTLLKFRASLSLSRFVYTGLVST